MRDPKKYQLSSDKYSLFQVQNITGNAGPSGGQSSPKLGQSTRSSAGVSQQQSIVPGMTNMNLMGNPPDSHVMHNHNQSAVHSSSVSNSNKSPVIQMSQISSGMVLNNRGPERGGGNPMQQKNASSSPNKNNRAAALHQSGPGPRGRNDQE